MPIDALDEEEQMVTIRAVYLMYRLMLGDRFTTKDVALMLGLSYQGAWAMLDRISQSHRIPLAGPVRGDKERYWHILNLGPKP